VATEGATLELTRDAIEEVAKIAADVNSRVENIGARRLHTVLTTLLDDVLFGLPEEGAGETIHIDGNAVRERLAHIVEDDDLRRYIL
jgi:ATP-dependent HslUV protease ATP-binding subunit HslU